MRCQGSSCLASCLCGSRLLPLPLLLLWVMDEVGFIFLGRLEWTMLGPWEGWEELRELTFAVLDGNLRDPLADSGDGGHLVRDSLLEVALSLSISEKLKPLSFREFLASLGDGSQWNRPKESR